MKRIWTAALCTFVMGVLPACGLQPRNSVSNVQEKAGKHAQVRPVIRVMGIGGSIAQGQKDPHKNGYLQRAFSTLSNQTSATYKYYDRAISGANSTQLATLYKGDYSKWMSTIHPQVVVISWGLLNDALPHTPMAAFKDYLNQEISEALATHAVVLVVTPPVTEASYTKVPQQEEEYTQAEIQTVSSLRDKNVYLFDVFHQMKQYLISHHQTIAPYVGDGNHPNTKGHELAGSLLCHDIIKQFGTSPIRFRQ